MTKGSNAEHWSQVARWIVLVEPGGALEPGRKVTGSLKDDNFHIWNQRSQKSIPEFLASC
jgi:hypothetical protein